METQVAWRYMSDITVPISMLMEEFVNYSSVQGIKWFLEPRQEMLFLCGENSKMTALTKEPVSLKPGSIAQHSATKAQCEARNLFAKRMQLLISSGLVKGITPTSTRKKLNQSCQESVSGVLFGDMYESVKDASEPKVDY